MTVLSWGQREWQKFSDVGKRTGEGKGRRFDVGAAFIELLAYWKLFKFYHLISFVPDPAWSEEVVLTLMAYMAVLSAALAIRRGAHIRMTALDVYLPKALIKFLDILADLCVFVLAIVMITVGWKYATSIGSKGYYVSMPTLSKFWQYFPIPLAGVAMVVFELEAIYNHIKSVFVKEGTGK